MENELHEPIIKPCLATFHPFKQKTYKYHGWDSESPNYCHSCYHYVKFLKLILPLFLIEGQESLYGHQQMNLDRDEAHDLIDQIYDEAKQE